MCTKHPLIITVTDFKIFSVTCLASKFHCVNCIQHKQCFVSWLSLSSGYWLSLYRHLQLNTESFQFCTSVPTTRQMRWLLAHRGFCRYSDNHQKRGAEPALKILCTLNSPERVHNVQRNGTITNQPCPQH